MGLFVYNIFLILFKAAIHITALFDEKAKKWLQGRKGIFKKLIKEVAPLHDDSAGNQQQNGNFERQASQLIWMHCASLGEFEQGRPVLEKLKSQYPNYKFLLTFFSPSGYEIRKHYQGVDRVSYLPLDGRRNAQRFLEIINPSLVIFVKYEYWYYYLEEIKQKNIPLLLVSALFRENSVFFRWYGGFQRKMLSFFTHIFVQNEESLKLLTQIGLSNKSSVAGDTRFDRVIQIGENISSIPVIEKFIGNSKAIVAGSTWKEDEEILQKAFTGISDPSLKLIFAPHEINEKHLADIKALFPGALWFSNYQDLLPATNEFAWDMLGKASNVLIIDNIGMLSRLYKYAYITYVGGGFGKGIHNILEAAVYGKPVLFGPSYEKFNEAIDLVANGGAVSVNNSGECARIIHKFLQDNTEYAK